MIPRGRLPRSLVATSVVAVAAAAAVYLAAPHAPWSRPVIAGLLVVAGGLLALRLGYAVRADRRYATLLEREVAAQTRSLMDSLAATAAAEHNVGVIVRVPFEESALTGKLTSQTKFTEGDFRNNYFAGDRLTRTIARVEKVRAALGSAEPDLPTAALKFALKPQAVSTVIPGIRNPDQAKRNCAVSDLPPLSDELEKKLRAHQWRRAFWYMGK